MVYEGIILEVYEIAKWLPAGSTFMGCRKIERTPDRYEFVGKIAAPKVREKYINKSVTNYFPLGNINPIRYLDEESLKESSRGK